MTGIARREAVDVVLVCGDVFEHYAPSAEAERIVYRALLDLRATGAEVVVMPGNHDNAEALRRRREPVQRPRACASFPRYGGRTMAGSSSSRLADGTRVQIACLPWVAERVLYSAADLMRDQEEPYKEYAEELPRLIGALCAAPRPGRGDRTRRTPLRFGRGRRRR